MTDRWRQVEELCHAVLARPDEERTAFLAVASSGDDLLRREVESLLAQESHTPGFLSSPAAASEWARARPGERHAGRQAARLLLDPVAARHWWHGRGLPRPR